MPSDVAPGASHAGKECESSGFEIESPKFAVSVPGELTQAQMWTLVNKDLGV